MMDGVLDHIRRAQPPWRSADARTECGRPLSDVASWITRDVLVQRITGMGKQRTSMTVCMTCWTTTGRSSTWETDPIEVLTRYLGERWSDGGAGPRLAREVRALAALVEAHRDEFEAYVSGLESTGDLAAARAARRRSRRR